MTARLSVIAALFLAALPTILLGQTSEEYAAMGQKLWAAFECGALAEYANKPEESRRLYNLGYDQGKTLLDAFRAGKVDQQARSKLPIPVLFMLDGGPTVGPPARALRSETIRLSPHRGSSRHRSGKRPRQNRLT
jgi:hypothetical protein